MSEASPRRKAFLWIALVFVIGAALGGVLGYSGARSRYNAPGSPHADEARRAHRVEFLTRELSLTEAQKQQVDQIISKLQAEYKDIHDQDVPRIQAAREKSRDAIRQILTPEQKPKFEEFLKRLDEERKHQGRD